MKAFEFIKKTLTASPALKHFPKGHLLVLGSLSGLLLISAAFISPESTARVSQPITLALASTKTTHSTPTTHPTPKEALISSRVNQTSANANKKAIAKKVIVPTPKTEATTWHTETVKSGDNLSLIFKRAGLSGATLHKLLSSNKKAKQLVNIYPGQAIAFNINNEGQLQSLRYKKSRLQTVEFTSTDTGFTDNVTTLKPDIHKAYREATIINSLFLAGTDVGLEESLIMELASIFGWDIDFALDIRNNDSFKVLYEEHFVNGEKLRNGPILAAEFINQNKSFRAVRYTDKDGKSNYFTPEGKSMRKAFLRTPVDFARISSHFNLKRKHPVLNTIRAHKGTDYAAPTGTPIKAAGNGKVVFAGTKGGYGRTVIIRHGQTYKTLYAHLHKYAKGIRNGKRVSQGQVIGYVGSSGLATGPHLHYEFYKNGAVRNPVRVSLPKAKSIPKKLLADFKLQTNPLVAQLDKLHNKSQLALSELEPNNQTQ